MKPTAKPLAQGSTTLLSSKSRRAANSFCTSSSSWDLHLSSSGRVGGKALELPWSRSQEQDPQGPGPPVQSERRQDLSKRPQQGPVGRVG